MNEKEIIDYYLKAKDKKKAIQDIKEATGLSIQEIYRKLRKNNILPPSKFKNEDEDEWEGEEDDDNKPEIVLKSFDDLEFDSDSIIQKFKQFGFYEKDKAQRAMNIYMYAEEEIGIDVWETFWDYLLQLIYNIEKTQLQSDIKSIKAGHFKKLKTVDNILDQIAISSAEEIQDTLKPKLVEPSKPKPKAQEDQWGKLIRFTNPKMYVIYKIMTDPQIKAEYIQAFNQYQQYSKLFKSKKLNLKNINLKQKEVENKPKERDVDLNQQEIRKFINSSMPKPKKDQQKKKRKKKS